jgi:hypothetical protein
VAKPSSVATPRHDRVVQQLVAGRCPLLADALALALEQQRHAARDHLLLVVRVDDLPRAGDDDAAALEHDDGAAAFAAKVQLVVRVAVRDRPVGGLVGAEDRDLHVPPLGVDARALRARDVDRAVRLDADAAGLGPDQTGDLPLEHTVWVEAGNVAAWLAVLEGDADEDDVLLRVDRDARRAEVAGLEPRVLGPVGVRLAPPDVAAEPLAPLVVAAQGPDHLGVLVVDARGDDVVCPAARRRPPC